MAGEFMILNPRKRKRRATKKTKSRKRRTRRARAHAAPKRRRRRIGARRHVARRRVRSNPRGMHMAGVDFKSAGFMAGGFILSNIGTGYISKMLPAGWQGPVARIGVKAVVGIGGPLLLKRFIGAKTANLLAAGAAVSVLVDAYQTWVAPNIPGLSDYEMAGYELGAGELTELPDGMSGNENIYADSIY